MAEEGFGDWEVMNGDLPFPKDNIERDVPYHEDKKNLITDLEDIRARIILAYESRSYIRLTYVPQLTKLIDAITTELNTQL